MQRNGGRGGREYFLPIPSLSLLNEPFPITVLYVKKMARKTPTPSPPPLSQTSVKDHPPYISFKCICKFFILLNIFLTLTPPPPSNKEIAYLSIHYPFDCMKNSGLKCKPKNSPGARISISGASFMKKRVTLRAAHTHTPTHSRTRTSAECRQINAALSSGGAFFLCLFK